MEKKNLKLEFNIILRKKLLRYCFLRQQGKNQFCFIQ